MSRLDSAIRRLLAQRDCLALGAGLIAGLPGPVLEFGLGNGRTFDHLRELFPEREIFAFDRRVAAHPSCIPDPGHMLLGEFRDTVPGAGARIGAPAALAHFDIGSGNSTADAALAEFLAGASPALMAAGGVVLSDQAMPAAGWSALALPESVAEGRYFMYRSGTGRGPSSR